MKTFQQKLIHALSDTTQFQCAVESKVSLSTIQNIVGGRKVSKQIEEKLTQWMENKERTGK